MRQEQSLFCSSFCLVTNLGLKSERHTTPVHEVFYLFTVLAFANKKGAGNKRIEGAQSNDLSNSKITSA